MVVGQVAPRAFVDGTIGLVHEGHSVTIDAIQFLIQLNAGMLLCFCETPMLPLFSCVTRFSCTTRVMSSCNLKRSR